MKTPILSLLFAVGLIGSAGAQTQLTGSLTNGLVAYYQGGSTQDYSGNGNTLVISNAPYTNGINNISQKAFYFSGTSASYAYTPNITSPTSDSFTWSALVKPSMILESQQYLIYSGGYFRNSPTLYINSDGSVTWRFSYDGGAYICQSPAGVVESGKWYSLLGLFNHDSLDLYINGRLVSHAAVDPSLAASLQYDPSFYFGGSPILGASYPYNGSMSDILIYNRALSTNEISQLYYLQNALSWTNGFGYSTNSNSVTILTYNGSNSSIAIPSKIGGIPVTSIGDNSFANQLGISSISIPSSVTNIGVGVFSGCPYLNQVTIPDSVVSFGAGIFSNSPNITISGSQSLITYFSQNASDLGFTGNALTSIRNGGTASGVFGWIENWLLADDSFISRLTARILSGANSYGIAVKQNQTLNFPAIAPITYASNATVNLSVTSSAGLTPVTYATANDAVAKIVSNNVLQIKGAGSTTVTASQAGNALYNPVSATQTLTVNPIIQKITFPAIPPKTFATTRTVTLAASSSANLPITYLIGNYAIASNATSNTITILGTGTTTVTATNAGTQNYSPAGATQTLIVK